MDQPDTAPAAPAAAGQDARAVVSFLVAQESDDYIAIMSVLDSPNDMTLDEIVTELRARGAVLDETLAQTRLDQLKNWGAVSARADGTAKLARYSDLLARNWRWTGTSTGRDTIRFWARYLTGPQTAREIPLRSLNAVVISLESLAELDLDGTGTWAQVATLVNTLFTAHDDLDQALVGAADRLVDLIDRFDLEQDDTHELKRLLVDYATHVANELETGAARATASLSALRHRFAELATIAVHDSAATELITSGALVAARGGAVGDWDALAAWLHPTSGRARAFSLRLIRALPAMHSNLRRLHTSTGTATGRARALALAKACLDPTYGTAIFLAANGDHPWRKLHGETEDDGLRLQSWHDAPRTDVPQMLRTTGRNGARGRNPAPKSDRGAREQVAARRSREQARHRAAVAEVLAATPGARLSRRAATVALASLMAAARTHASGRHGARYAAKDGLAVTLFRTPGSDGVIDAGTWRVLTPGRTAVFHRPGTRAALPTEPTAADADERAVLLVRTDTEDVA